MGCNASTPADEHAHRRRQKYSTKVSAEVDDPPPLRPVDAPPPEPPDVRSIKSFHDEYVLMGRLGEGAFASVHIAKGLDGKQVAVKVTDLRSRGSPGWSTSQLDSKKWACAAKEVKILEKVAGLEYVVNFFCSSMEGGLSYVVMEKCDMSLYQVLLRKQPALNEATLAQTLVEMLQGIAAVHSVGIIHRDVKPDNYMATGAEGAMRLCDFGLAACVDPARGAGAPVLKGVFGTPPYMAPEMLQGPSYGAKVDVWSYGVIVYSLLFGKFPYQPAKPTGAAMKAAIVAGVPAPTFTAESRAAHRGAPLISHQALSLSRAVLERAPGQRMRAKDVLRHAFFHMSMSERGTASLRPMLYSARRNGAFSPACAGEAGAPSGVDRRLAELQEGRLQRPQLPSIAKAYDCKRRCGKEPSDATSTSMGSIGSEGSALASAS